MNYFKLLEYSERIKIFFEIVKLCSHNAKIGKISTNHELPGRKSYPVKLEPGTVQSGIFG
jgi:hypothetical protein